MKKIVYTTILVLGVVLCAPANSFAQFAKSEFEQFKAANPDIKKYEFVNDFLLALDQIQKNQKQYDRWLDNEKMGVDAAQHTKEYIEFLKQANIQYRMANNFLKKYNRVDNGLMLKVVQIFSQACDEIVDINNSEREILTAYYDALTNDKLDDFDEEKMAEDQLSVANQRKESNLKILESSMYIKKILISNQPNKYGEFVRLGITEDERQNLINRLNLFFGESNVNEVQAGQTFLEASVSAIREILQDYKWLAKDT